MTEPSLRRRKLVGFKYQVGPNIGAEVRRSCRDEMKILYTGGPFGPEVWQRLSALGELRLFEASKVNPKMKDLASIRAPGVRIEGAVHGALVVVFFEEERRGARRHAVEALLVR